MHHNLCSPPPLRAALRSLDFCLHDGSFERAMTLSGLGVWRMVLIGLGGLVLHGCGTLGSLSKRSVTLPADTQAKAESESKNRILDLERQVQEREAELATLRAELEKLRSETGLGWSSEPLENQEKGGQKATAPSVTDQLSKQVTDERFEKQALLQELERLQQEVSSPFAETRVPESDYLALKQELIELRRQLRRQEEEHQQLMARIAALPSPVSSAGNVPPRVESQNGEHRHLAEETERELAASRARVAELESALASARSESEKSRVLVQENDMLKSQLAEERRRAEALEAKLKIATRITELIFRMRSQEQPQTQRLPQAGGAAD